MRKQRLSGVYYKATPILLDKQLQECFNHPKGPGELPVKALDKKVTKPVGAIVPMFTYDIAGPCAAWGYKEVIEEFTPDIFLILCQSKSKDAGLTTEPFETPYGVCRVDTVLAKAILEKKNIDENNALFDDDDQVESQLPLMQFVNPKKMEGIKILPIMVSSETSIKKLAVDIKEVLMEQNKKAIIIVPTNFTSYGMNHGYVPFSIDAHKNVYDMDKAAIDLLTQNDLNGFLKYVDDKAMNMNNYLGILLAMLIIKPKKVLLEQYYTTADLNKDFKNFTSFASIVMK